MKKVISILALATMAFSAIAQDDNIIVGRRALGSGQPGLQGEETISRWVANEPIYTGPQYMVGYPTAASLWARVVEVPCSRVSGKLVCDGYEWQPRLGRGEYLFVRPVLVKEQPVKEVVVVKEVVKVVEVPCCHNEKPKKIKE